MAPLTSCHVLFGLFSESFIYISNIWWPSADILRNHRVKTGQRYSSILSHRTTVHMTLMAKRHKSLLEFQWKVHTRWERGLLVQCKIQNKCGAEGLHLETDLCKVDCLEKEKRATASEHSGQITDALDDSRW